MLTSSLDQREVEILILALRYWRAQRAGHLRRTDPALTPDTIDLLLAKLSSQIPTPGTPGVDHRSGFASP
jgi:hypothetical protein